MSIKKITPVAASAFVGLMLIGAFSFIPSAQAAVTFDPKTGKGFVGKGDVQTALNLNNKQIQQQASQIEFRAESVVVTEVTWECTNTNKENVRERARTTTTSIQGIVDSETRERNQVTGFILEGYEGTPTRTSTTEGPPVNSCPSGPWTLTEPAGDPEVVSSTTALQVRSGSGDWVTL